MNLLVILFFFVIFCKLHNHNFIKISDLDEEIFLTNNLTIYDMTNYSLSLSSPNISSGY